MRLLYTVILYLAIPVVLLRLLWRSRRAPEYARRWGERFGFFGELTASKKVVWIHTVSVGEFIAALPLIRILQQQPDTFIAITTTTPTGSERVRATLGETVFHVYAPYDLPDCIARFLARVKPQLMITMETELWPNTIAACTAREIPVVLINARLSARSARGYQRFSAITRPMLQRLSCAAIQHSDDAARFRALGLPQKAAEITGNIKFDLTLNEDVIQQAHALKQQWSACGERLVWIAASTHAGEDEQILKAFSALRQSAGDAAKVLLVLVPRHPERFDRVGQLCSDQGFTVARRSQGEINGETDIVLGDTMGELLLMFGASDIAFIGGSLVPNGGHNFIEAAVWRLPLLSGIHVFNFAEASRLLTDAGALTLVDSPEALAQQLVLLVNDAKVRKARGLAAQTVANANRGAMEKTLEIIKRYL